MRNYKATNRQVLNRGIAPSEFLDTLIEWARGADSAIFTPNARVDIYSLVRADLGPETPGVKWGGLLDRKATMLEVLRVLAAFESGWDWKCGRDTTNPTSGTPLTEETGAFQVSANSMAFDSSLGACVKHYIGTADPRDFIAGMKANHFLAVEYCARLLRINEEWDGPVKRHKINPWLSRDAKEEFKTFLT